MRRPRYQALCLFLFHYSSKRNGESPTKSPSIGQPLACGYVKRCIRRLANHQHFWFRRHISTPLHTELTTVASRAAFPSQLSLQVQPNGAWITINGCKVRHYSNIFGISIVQTGMSGQVKAHSLHSCRSLWSPRVYHMIVISCNYKFPVLVLNGISNSPYWLTFKSWTVTNSHVAYWATPSFPFVKVTNRSGFRLNRSSK